MSNATATQRTDPHRPSEVVPADYSYAASFAYPTSGDPGYMQDLRALGESMTPRWGQFFHKAEGGGCDVCGANYIEGAAFLHVPTGQYIKVGHICAEKLDLPVDQAAARRIHQARMERSKASRRMGKGRKLAQQYRESLTPAHHAAISLAHQHAEWQAARLATDEAGAWAVPCECCASHPEQENHCRRCWPTIGRGWNIILDVDRRGAQYGSISQAQADLILKIAADEAAKAEAPPEQHVDAPEGRLEVRGTVVSTKWQETDFGRTPRMTVKIETPAGSWLAWGTVPNALLEASDMDSLRGAAVVFTATLTRGRDAHFAIYKRPTKAALAEG